MERLSLQQKMGRGFAIASIALAGCTQNAESQAPEPTVKMQIDGPDLRSLDCARPTDKEGVDSLPGIEPIDVVGGYNTPKAAVNYFKPDHNELNWDELQKTQSNSTAGRYEIPKGGIFLVQKQAGRWTPYIHAACHEEQK